MIIRGNRKSLEKKAGSLLAQMIGRFLRKQPTVVLGVPGGRSVTSVLRHLVAEPVESCPEKLVREIPEHYILVQEDA